jgi:hypothetical protein
MSHILQEAALFNILTEHNRSRGESLDEKSLVQSVNCCADGLQAHLVWRVSNQNGELRKVATLGFK